MLKTILTLTAIVIAVKVIRKNENQSNTRELFCTSEGFKFKPHRNYPVHLNVVSLQDLNDEISLLKN